MTGTKLRIEIYTSENRTSHGFYRKHMKSMNEKFTSINYRQLQAESSLRTLRESLIQEVNYTLVNNIFSFPCL